MNTIIKTVDQYGKTTSGFETKAEWYLLSGEIVFSCFKIKPFFVSKHDKGITIVVSQIDYEALDKCLEHA